VADEFINFSHGDFYCNCCVSCSISFVTCLGKLICWQVLRGSGCVCAESDSGSRGMTVSCGSKGVVDDFLKQRLPFTNDSLSEGLLANDLYAWTFICFSPNYS
jgi:hypothetical protein